LTVTFHQHIPPTTENAIPAYNFFEPLFQKKEGFFGERPLVLGWWVSEFLAVFAGDCDYVKEVYFAAFRRQVCSCEPVGAWYAFGLAAVCSSHECQIVDVDFIASAAWFCSS